jgi:hypothetical protein
VASTDTITLSGVAPDPVAESQGVAGEMEVLTVSAEPVLPTDSVCDDFRFVEVCTNDKDAGDPVNSGELLTTSVIGMRSGLFAAPDDVTTTVS